MLVYEQGNGMVEAKHNHEFFNPILTRKHIPE